MNRGKRLSRACILRLELYLDLLEQLREEDKRNVTSTEIGSALGLDPVKVRQDLFGLGSADGRPKIGYEVTHLIKMLRHLFDVDRIKPVCIVGCGNLGKALAGSNIWNKAGYRLVAVFDNDPELVGSELAGFHIRSIGEMFGVIKTEAVETAVITVPVKAAQDTADLLLAAGIKAIWNFTQANIQTPDDVIVENQFLAWGLITLSHRVKWTQE